MAKIGDEIRDFVKRSYEDEYMDPRELLVIADRIDAEHERTVGFCKRLEDAAAKREDVEIFGVEYTALPLDADGEPIRVGNVMEWCDSGETLTVEGIGSDVLFYIDGENAEWTAARNKRHHHEPTVEDVLFEFARFWSDEELTDIEHLQPQAAQTIAEYAAKLRLAEGVDE